MIGILNDRIKSTERLKINRFARSLEANPLSIVLLYIFIYLLKHSTILKGGAWAYSVLQVITAMMGCSALVISPYITLFGSHVQLRIASLRI